MERYIVVGAGGTGGYFISDLLQYLITKGKPATIHVVDGDIVEEKNLLRQAFFEGDVGKYKSRAVVDRINTIGVPDYLTVTYSTDFINSVEDLKKEVVDETGETKTYTIVSCVDNNMARLRISLGIYALQDELKKEIRFLDSGNTEYTGQTLVTILKARGQKKLSGLYEIAKKGIDENGNIKEDKIKDVLEEIKSFTVKEGSAGDFYWGIFAGNTEWKDELTKGDFEMSCDDLAVSNPQNIGANMTASTMLLTRLSEIDRNTFNGGELRFDSNANTFEEVGEGRVEEGYDEWLQSAIEYIGTINGYTEVISNEIVVVEASVGRASVGEDDLDEQVEVEQVEEQEVEQELEQEEQEVEQEDEQEVEQEVEQEEDEGEQEVQEEQEVEQEDEQEVEQVEEQEVEQEDEQEEVEQEEDEDDIESILRGLAGDDDLEDFLDSLVGNIDLETEE